MNFHEVVYMCVWGSPMGGEPHTKTQHGWTPIAKTSRVRGRTMVEANENDDLARRECGGGGGKELEE